MLVKLDPITTREQKINLTHHRHKLREIKGADPKEKVKVSINKALS